MTKQYITSIIHIIAHSGTANWPRAMLQSAGSGRPYLLINPLLQVLHGYRMGYPGEWVRM